LIVATLTVIPADFDAGTVHYNDFALHPIRGQTTISWSWRVCASWAFIRIKHVPIAADRTNSPRLRVLEHLLQDLQIVSAAGS